jgi:hypothetical protein
MVKAWLRDDVDLGGSMARRTHQYRPVHALVDGDCGYDEEVAPWAIGDLDPTLPGNEPMFVLYRRVRTGYDDEGNPTFDWREFARARAIQYTEREEIDPVAGTTHVRAEIMLLFDGQTEPHETMIAVDENGDAWRVTSHKQVGQRLEIRADRLDQEPD